MSPSKALLCDGEIDSEEILSSADGRLTAIDTFGVVFSSSAFAPVTPATVDAIAAKSIVSEIAASSNKGFEACGSVSSILATAGFFGSGLSMLAIKGLLSSILSTNASL